MTRRPSRGVTHPESGVPARPWARALTLLAIGGVSASIAGVVVAEGQTAPAVPPPMPRQAAIAPAGTAPAAIGIGALGRIEPASRIRKLSPAGAMNVSRLGDLLVREGDRVTSGQLLAEFADARLKDAAVAQAQATVRQAEATLARIRAGGRPEDIQAQREHVEALRANEASLRRDAERSEALSPSGVTSKSTVERNQFAAASATSQRAGAEAALAKLLVPWPADIAVADAELAAARAALTKARADADLSRVYAPIAGTILKIYTRPGDQVGGDGVLDMADLDQIEVVADVYETDLPRLREGAEAELIVAGDTIRYAARVREIGWIVRRISESATDPVAATDARTVEVRLVVGEAGRAALSHRMNMRVQVAIRP